ncbi:hypothetical protein JDV02_006902 [Purpureocillium takamizusanense]|uniref:Major facilitator superfamily (MFS) profile domain-containing protein n=1 Tax=Purpureocillium takamizusanense TaxID=2060973 RepID=A0A9Q8VCN0_9HYPO|nr:uncharacterized protein JDV02_006902 [Purpureocillium takamizusanense]UNI20853.1 hypothetical protein JDV02_006902 [Purpureocillium takamizusanense]
MGPQTDPSSSHFPFAVLVNRLIVWVGWVPVAETIGLGGPAGVYPRGGDEGSITAATTTSRARGDGLIVGVGIFQVKSNKLKKGTRGVRSSLLLSPLLPRDLQLSCCPRFLEREDSWVCACTTAAAAATATACCRINDDDGDNGNNHAEIRDTIKIMTADADDAAAGSIAVSGSPSRKSPLHKHNVANRLYKSSLLNTVCIVAGISIFFFGYDQGLMGGVNTTRDYAERMGFGHYSEERGLVVVDRPLLQGGIVAVYYLPGTLAGCLLGGWLGDKYGRIWTIGVACVWCIVAAALQSAAMNANWMFCARVLNGIGTGILNAITPVWATETASHKSRGQFVAVEFTLNIFGVVVAYWLEFGTSKFHDPTSSFIWRFPVAFQIVPLVFLFCIIWYMPESPRWLVKAGREEEARYILGRLRGEHGDDALAAEAEFQDIVNIRDLEHDTAAQQSYLHMLFGVGSGKLHTGRRVQLVVWLQILQEWIGIAGITIYGPEIFTIAGISSKDRLWVSGVNNITYMFATLICVFTLDRIGRRWTLYWGAIGQGICMFAAGGLARATINAEGQSNQAHIGGAATFFVFLYTAIFGATWLTVPWLYPAEIFPLQVRAKGNAWGVVGWSIGNGWTVLLLPTIFNKLNEKTLYIFGAVNALSIVAVWALYPESNQRTLEEMDLVFASDSIWTWEAEKNFARLKAENPQLVQAAKAGHGAVVDPEQGVAGSRKASLVARDGQGNAGAATESGTNDTEKSSVSHL